jgi:hypothetical protein
VRYIDLRNGFAHTRVINKLGPSWSDAPKTPIWK